MANKPRIAILGGGVGAVTAAFHLSQDGWQNHYESITLYQQGWRLGGKGASGRGPRERIEEHGLHVWFGFYENAFRMLHDCHMALDEREASDSQPRWPLAFKTMEDSFRPCNEVYLSDYDGCGWKLWVADFFAERDDWPWADPDLRPPAERPAEWSVLFYLVRCLRLASDMAWSLTRSDAGLEIVAAPAVGARHGLVDLDEAAGKLWSLLSGDIREVLNGAADLLDALVDEAYEQPLVLDVLGLVMGGLDFVVDFLRRRYDALVRSNDGVRRAYYIVDVLIAIVRGVIDDGVIEEESFDVIDDIDFRDWLLAHGAARDSVDCALVRAVVYDLAFAYEDGDPQRPSCGAGTALRGLLRTFFTYRGALMWKMNAGMGDVVFAPLYELLVKRGVDVRFFHRVEAVRAANGAVEEIEIDVQEEVPSGTARSAYLGSPWAASAAGSGSSEKAVWPAAPAPDLTGKHGSSALPADTYESWYAGRAGTKRTEVLQNGATDGFDLVVFGLPISCVPHVAPDLPAQSDRWRAAVEHLRTVPTQAMQLWLNRPASELGDAADGAVLGGFVEPFDTWADMDHLTSAEDVNSATIAYFCNVLVDTPPPVRGAAAQWLKDRNDVVRANALRFLIRDIGTLWPNAVDSLTGEFDWQLLVDPDGMAGPERLRAQFLRANVEPSERYVLSVPGSAVHRISPGDTGFGNLYAAGDWTSCAINAGCVEAAVISGMRAANAIHRDHGDANFAQSIVGEEGP
jgi:uncharacterized protein with NAD-binding domain and iron-sulfur cluster